MSGKDVEDVTEAGSKTGGPQGEPPGGPETLEVQGRESHSQIRSAS